MANNPNLDPEQEQKRLDALQKQNATLKEMASSYEKAAKSAGELKKEDEDILDYTKQLAKFSTTIEKSIQQRLTGTSSVKDLTKTVNELEKEITKNKEGFNKIQGDLNKKYQEALRSNSQILATLEEEKKAQNIANQAAEAANQHYKDLLAAKASGQNVSKRQLDLAKLNLDIAKEEETLAKESVKELTESHKKQEDILKGLVQTKQTHEAIVAEQEKELELTKKHLAAKKSQNILDAAAEASGLKRIKDAFTLLGIFKFLIDSTFKVEQQITELGKSLGVSHDVAKGIRNEFASYAAASKDTFVNTERLLKAQQGLTEQLGIAVKFSGEEAETFARLTEITGLAANEAGALAQNAAATGVGTKEYVANLRSAAFEAMRATNTHISDKKLLQDISKLSAGILVKFQGNPKAIAEAVVQANKLGLSLDKVDKIGESLLNWESSIENELQAELITGKQLNFERARAAALSGDQVELMNEMTRQAGSLADFQNMNVIAQQSLAQAFGMSRDEMSEMLMKQEAVNKYGDAAAKLNKEQLEDMKRRNMSADDYLKMVNNQRSTQERFNDIMLKFQDTIANIAAGPLGTMLNLIASILENSTLLAALFGGVMVANLMKFVKGLKLAKSLSIGEAIIQIIKGAWASVGGMPVVGPVLAGAAIAGGIAFLNSQTSKGEKGDDVMSEGGYGNRTLLTPKGSIKLNNQDTVIAGTNLGGGDKINRNEGGNNNALMAAMANKFNTAIDSLSKRPSVAYINGKDAFADDLGRSTSLGTSQIQNSYKLA